MADPQKSFLLKLDDEAHERLAADALARYGQAFGLDAAGNARKVAELRSRSRAVA